MYSDLEITFKSRKLAKQCNSRQAAQKKWGTMQGNKVLQRLNEMRAADTLADLGKLKYLRLHPLVGDRRGQWSVDVIHPYRLLFVPTNEPLPLKPDGSVDEAQVTAVEVQGVEDTHG